MSLFRRYAIILLVAGMMVALSGCLAPGTNTPVTPAPGAQVIPIPIPEAYIKNGSITSPKIAPGAVNNTHIAANSVNDTQLAPIAIVYNATQNVSGTTITGATLVMLNGANGTITVNRTSMLVMTLSFDSFVTGGTTLTSYGQVRVNGVSSTGFYGVPVPAKPNLVAFGASYNLKNATSYTFYNDSVDAGTYNITIAGALHSASGVLTMSNISLVTIAYPK